MSDLEDTVKPVSSLVAVRRLLPLAGKQTRYLPLSFLLLAVSASVQTLLPQVMRIAIDGPLGIDHPGSILERWETLADLGGLFLGLLLIGFCATYFSTWLLQKFGQSLVLNLRHQLFSKIHRLPVAYFDKHAVGRTVTRIVNDSNALSELFTSVLAAGLGDLMLLLGILIVLLFSDPSLFTILLLFCPFLVALVIWFRSRSAPLYQEQRALVAKINAFFSEVLEGLATVKVFQANAFQTERFSKINHSSLQNELSLLTLVARFRPGFAVAQMAATAAMLVVGGLSIIDGHSTVGTLVSSLFYIRLLFSPLEQLAERYNILIRATVASERVLAILGLEEEPQGGTAPTAGGAITFERVSFQYQPDKPVLQEVSFQLNPGQSLALVGATGSGKSTIVSLLLGFYRLDPEHHQGDILFGDISLKEIDLALWRKNIAFVSQDLFLFKGSVTQNVALFQEIEPEAIQDALKRADCEEFVSNLPHGVDTIVGEKGHALSTGQRQLLSFARALAFDPQILILDEATANIDSETETRIEKALDALLENRQAIIVAHRLSTVKRADKILVLDEGRVIEQGNHQELLELGGTYAEMIKSSERSEELL